MTMTEKEKEKLFREAEKKRAAFLKARQAPLCETILNVLRHARGFNQIDGNLLAKSLVEAIWAKFFVQPIDAERRGERAKKSFEIQQALRVNEHQTDFLVSEDVSPHDVTVLTWEETCRLRRRWEAIYIGNRGADVPLHKCAACDHGGVSKYTGYNWSVFDYERTPAQRIESWTDEEDEKRITYLNTLEIKEDKLIVLWEQCHYLALELPTPVVKRCRFDIDVYVFPRSLVWTFISTHENFSFYAQKPS
jgi:hypothetical protein